MKKIAFLFVTLALLASCTGNKSQQQTTTEETQVASKRATKDLNESFEEQQIRAGMSVQLDSLTAAWLRVGKSPLKVNMQEKKFVLNEEEKMIKPDYLMDPAEVMSKLETLSLKYRALAVFSDEKEIADLYDMPDVYSEPITLLAADVNDPAMKYALETSFDSLNVADIYAIEEQYGRVNYFWEAAATMTIEHLYILTKNQEMYLKNFTDKDAEDITFRVVLLLDAFEELSDYNHELRRLYNLLRPLEVLDAITVDQLRGQLTQMKKEIEQARATLFL